MTLTATLLILKKARTGIIRICIMSTEKRMPSGKTEQNFFETSMTKIIGVFVLQIFCGTVTDIINRQ